MMNNFEEIQSMSDGDNFLEQTKNFSNCFGSLIGREHFYPSNQSRNTNIELDEDKEEKDKMFSKSFKEIFSNNKNSFTNEEIIDNIIPSDYTIRIKKPIFAVITPGRKRGRLRKGSNPSYQLKKDKFENNNIIQKITRHFVNGSFDFLNRTHERNIFPKNPRTELFLKKIEAEAYNVYSNKKIYELFYMTLGDLFSSDVSDKNSNLIRIDMEDYNKKRIELLKKENKEKNVIEILNLTVIEMYVKFLDNELDDFNLENHLVEIEKKDGFKYKEKYKKIALDLINILKI